MIPYAPAVRPPQSLQLHEYVHTIANVLSEKNPDLPVGGSYEITVRNGIAIFMPSRKGSFYDDSHNRRKSQIRHNRYLLSRRRRFLSNVDVDNTITTDVSRTNYTSHTYKNESAFHSANNDTTRSNIAINGTADDHSIHAFVKDNEHTVIQIALAGAAHNGPQPTAATQIIYVTPSPSPSVIYVTPSPTPKVIYITPTPSTTTPKVIYVAAPTQAPPLYYPPTASPRPYPIRAAISNSAPRYYLDQNMGHPYESHAYIGPSPDYNIENDPMYQRLYKNLLGEIMYRVDLLFRSRHVRTRRDVGLDDESRENLTSVVTKNVSYFGVADGTSRIELFYNATRPLNISYHEGHLTVGDPESKVQSKIRQPVTYNISETRQIESGHKTVEINTQTNHETINIGSLVGLFYNWDGNYSTSTTQMSSTHSSVRGDSDKYLCLVSIISGLILFSCVCAFLYFRYYRNMTHIRGQPIRHN